MRSPYRRGPRLAQPRKVAPGRAKQPSWDESRQRANVSHGDTFDWRVGERVDGPPRIKTAPFVGLPPDGGAA
jgi:hypothetical protein